MSTEDLLLSSFGNESKKHEKWWMSQIKLFFPRAQALQILPRGAKYNIT